MIWEPLNCDLILVKVYLRIHEYGLEIPLNIVYKISIEDQRYKLPLNKRTHITDNLHVIVYY